MLNQMILVGRIKKIKDTFIYIENQDNVFKIKVGQTIIDNMKKFTKAGDLIGVKGKIDKDEHNKTIIIGEKVTFLSNSNEE